MNITQTRNAEDQEKSPLQHHLHCLRQRLMTGQIALERRINGQDGEGAVEIVLGADGSVAETHLDRHWRSLQGDMLLSAAVLEAYRSAQASQLAEWADAVTDDSALGRPRAAAPESSPPPAPERRDPQPAHPAPSSRPPVLLRHGTAELPQALAHIRSLSQPRDEVAEGVRVARRGALVTDIEFGPWVAGATDTQIAHVITTALRSAGTQATDMLNGALAAYPALYALTGPGLGHRITRSDVEATTPEEGTSQVYLLLAHVREQMNETLRRGRARKLPEWADIGVVACTSTGLLEQIHRAAGAALDHTEQQLAVIADRDAVARVGAASLALAWRLQTAETTMAGTITMAEGLWYAIGAVQTYLSALAEPGLPNAQMAG